mmetsp:Transcript_89408/g.154674  ORF Transcript_89408/g.154674 Transcript_89408/m.154674 type:complete len:161 (-) Transcript_89408:149-631(-)
MGQCGCSSCFAAFMAQRATSPRMASEQSASTNRSTLLESQHSISLRNASTGSTLSANTKWQLKLMETDEASPTSGAQRQSLLDEIEWQQNLRAIEQSKITGGVKKCFICGVETRGGLKSPTHPDCLHVACSVEHMLKMEVEWVGIRHGLAEGDKMLSGCE